MEDDGGQFVPDELNGRSQAEQSSDEARLAQDVAELAVGGRQPFNLGPMQCS